MIDNPADRFAVDALLTGTSLDWVLTEADISAPRVVAGGEKSIDELSVWLFGQWSDGAEARENLVAPEMTDATATAATAVIATRARWLLGRAKEAKVILERGVPTGSLDLGFHSARARHASLDESEGTAT